MTGCAVDAPVARDYSPVVFILTVSEIIAHAARTVCVVESRRRNWRASEGTKEDVTVRSEHSTSPLRRGTQARVVRTNQLRGLRVCVDAQDLRCFTRRA